MPLDKENLFNRIYDNFETNYLDPQYINKRAILCPLNSEVEEINKLAGDRIPSEYTNYLSIDSIVDGQNNNNHNFNLEYLNQIKISGIPLHEIKLKIGMPVILMRNLSNTKGLCNGTRMIVTGN
jgi:ATP-dependent DNA helicase PIF1